MAELWNVESLEDFLYYWCPECGERNQSREDFLQHALNQHPVSSDYLIKFCVKKELNDEYYYAYNNEDDHLNDYTTGWAKPQVSFFSQEKLGLFYPIFWFQ